MNLKKELEKKGLMLYNYKEPLKKVDRGFGYQGVLLSSLNGDKVQCHICGNLFRNLTHHILLAHEISNKDYKIKFGLARLTSLSSETLRKERSMRHIKYLMSLTPKQIKERIEKMKAGLRRYYSSPERFGKNPKLSLEVRNRNGTCPDQVLDQIKKLASRLGHSPSIAEFRKYHKDKYLGSIRYFYGSWSNAKRLLNLEVGNKSGEGLRPRRRHSKEHLISEIKRFYDVHKRVPTISDCHRGLLPSYSSYYRILGGLPNSRKLAFSEN